MIREPEIAVPLCTDAEIVAASLSDPERFAEIFERHFGAIHGYLARRAGVSLADDLASQVFVVAFERRGSLRDDCSSARPWLYGIATNLLRNNARSERRFVAALARLEVASPAVTPAEMDRVEAGGDRRLIAAALAELDQDQRDVLVLHAWEGLSHSEIADALGVPPGTVASRLARGRRRLRAALGEPDERSVRGARGSASPKEEP